MKTMLILCLLALSLSADAGDDKENAAVSAAVPSAKTIDKTSYGYRVQTDSGTVFVNKTSYGDHVADGKKSVFITKTYTGGYRISPDR